MGLEDPDLVHPFAPYPLGGGVSLEDGHHLVPHPAQDLRVRSVDPHLDLATFRWPEHERLAVDDGVREKLFKAVESGDQKTWNILGVFNLDQDLSVVVVVVLRRIGEQKADLAATDEGCCVTDAFLCQQPLLGLIHLTLGLVDAGR